MYATLTILSLFIGISADETGSVCCYVFQRFEVCCSVLQFVAVSCRVLQCVAAFGRVLHYTLQCVRDSEHPISFYCHVCF